MPAHQWLAVESKLLGPLGCSQSEMSRPLGLSMLTKSKSHWQTIATDPGFQWISVCRFQRLQLHYLKEGSNKTASACACLSWAWWYTVQINVYPLSIFPAPTHPTWMCIAFSKAPDSALLLSMCRYLLLIQHTPHVLEVSCTWSYSIWFHVSSRKMIALDSTIV